MIKTPTEAEERLKAFAEKESQITALYKGKCSEEGGETYYFLAPGQRDFDLDDRLADVYRSIRKEFGVSIDVTIGTSKKPEDHGLKEYDCIYQQ